MEQPATGAVYAHKRRSTRVVHAMPLTVAGRDAAGSPLQEQTATISLNCHGCRYFSRHRVEKDSWLMVQLPGAPSSPLRARVAWIEKSRRLKGLFQVAVEFEAPGNIWGIAKPPTDWQSFAAGSAFERAATEAGMKRLLALAEKGNYYQLLGVDAFCARAQVKAKFYELARRFHPDHHMIHPEWSEPLHRLMDTLTLAYKTLSDDSAREQYDRRRAASGAFTLGQNKTETQKSAQECLEKARECLRAQNFVGSIVWLRKAAAIEPGSSKYHALLGRSLAAVPQYRCEAAEHFQKALELDPLNEWAHFQYGKLLEEMRLPWRAVLHYRKILEVDPGHAAARERLDAIDGATSSGSAPRILDRLLSHLRK